MELFAGLTVEFALQLLGWLVFGVLVGALSAMLGIGGGVVMVPTFRLVGRLTPLMSTATSLFVIVPTSIAGVWRHLRAGTCRVPIGLIIGLGGACTSVLGTRLAIISPGWLIMCVAALVIVYSAWNMFKKGLARPKRGGVPAKGAKAANSPADEETAPAVAATTDSAPAGNPAPAAAATASVAPAPAPTFATSGVSRKEVIVALVIGLAAGILSGFVGVGGGFIIVPLLCSVLGMNMKQAAGTSLLAVLCLATPAAIAQVISGNVDIPLACAVIVGSVVGAVLGQKAGAKLPDRALRLFFGGLLAITAILLVVNEVGLLN